MASAQTNGSNGAQSRKTCLVTGGASGMGWAVSEHLLKSNWNVMIVDYNESLGQEVVTPYITTNQAIFMKADVADYEELAATFARTWKQWGRLDAVFANAGIGDRINFYAQQEDREDGTPPKPNMSVIDIDLYGPIYCAWLAMHYFRKNQDKVGKLVFTSSMAGIYTGGGVPLYSAAKSGACFPIRPCQML
jgi:15-hydroxyprostaglandin dehydrogenase (NAD)